MIVNHCGLRLTFSYRFLYIRPGRDTKGTSFQAQSKMAVKFPGCSMCPFAAFTVDISSLPKARVSVALTAEAPGLGVTYQRTQVKIETVAIRAGRADNTCLIFNNYLTIDIL